MLLKGCEHLYSLSSAVANVLLGGIGNVTALRTHILVQVLTTGPPKFEAGSVVNISQSLVILE
jgi:hypothetical protein